jgi:dTDP-4-dehydrorhamnose 3,5-epimerase
VRLVETPLAGVLRVEPLVHQDERGFFLEVFHAGKFEAQGLALAFVQDNHSQSRRGTLRGLHVQTRAPQGKLVRCVEGEIWDVAVDVRIGSPGFGRWHGERLSDSNFHQLWIPPGFAHGFCVLSERAQVEYKCTTLYDPESDLAIAWNDPVLAVSWPLDAPVLSDKDAAAAPLAALADRLPRYQGLTPP